MTVIPHSDTRVNGNAHKTRMLSRQAIRLLRLCWSLSKRDGYAAVRVPRLGEMLAQDCKREKPYSPRMTHYYLAELRGAECVETQTDYRMVYIKPLVPAPPKGSKRTPTPPRAFSCPAVAEPDASLIAEEIPQVAQPDALSSCARTNTDFRDVLTRETTTDTPMYPAPVLPCPEPVPAPVVAATFEETTDERTNASEESKAPAEQTPQVSGANSTGKALPVESEPPTLTAMKRVGVSARVAAQLWREKPAECARQVAYLPHRKADDPPAVLVTAIWEAWSMPAALAPKTGMPVAAPKNRFTKCLPPAAPVNGQTGYAAFAAQKEKMRFGGHTERVGRVAP